MPLIVAAVYIQDISLCLYDQDNETEAIFEETLVGIFQNRWYTWNPKLKSFMNTKQNKYKENHIFFIFVQEHAVKWMKMKTMEKILNDKEIKIYSKK